jgi:hypothetical protein
MPRSDFVSAPTRLVELQARLDIRAGDAGKFHALDAGALDAGALDAGALDAGALDAGALDAGAGVNLLSGGEQQQDQRASDDASRGCGQAALMGVRVHAGPVLRIVAASVIVDGYGEKRFHGKALLRASGLGGRGTIAACAFHLVVRCWCREPELDLAGSGHGTASRSPSLEHERD